MSTFTKKRIFMFNVYFYAAHTSVLLVTYLFMAKDWSCVLTLLNKNVSVLEKKLGRGSSCALFVGVVVD